jgi:hypothetical protein
MKHEPAELHLPVREYFVLAARNARGALTPRELRDANGRTLNSAAAIRVFGGASLGQALNRALREAHAEATAHERAASSADLDAPIPFSVTDAGWDAR